MKKVDIIMVGYNHSDLTKKAIESLIATTPLKDFSLIFIDNGSSDDTYEIVRKILIDNVGFDLHYVKLDNVGFLKAVNMVVNKRTLTDYFLTCHNDVVFCENWLPLMLKRFNDDDKIAAVGCVSNFALGLQSITYNLVGVISEHAKFLVGFFCLFKTKAIYELVDKDGYFMDDIFGLGDKEEQDYCIRLSKLGYKFRIARNVYIEHLGEKGFIDVLGSQGAFHEYQDEQLKKLYSKWDKDIVDDLYQVDLSKRVNVVIGTPLRNNYTHYRFFASSVSMFKIPSFQYVTTVRHIISEARNTIVEKALAFNATHVLFIDDDMIFPENAALKLLTHDVDIVCGLAFRRLPPYDPCIFKQINSDIHPIEAINKGLVEIDACGSAFILINIKVFKNMPKPWYVWGDKSLDIYENVGGLGEDIAFSLKAKRMGFGVYCDTDLIIQHIGEEEIVDDKVYMKCKQERMAKGERVEL